MAKTNKAIIKEVEELFGVKITLIYTKIPDLSRETFEKSLYNILNNISIPNEIISIKKAYRLDCEIKFLNNNTKTVINIFNDTKNIISQKEKRFILRTFLEETIWDYLEHYDKEVSE